MSAMFTIRVLIPLPLPSTWNNNWCYGGRDRECDVKRDRECDVKRDRECDVKRDRECDVKRDREIVKREAKQDRMWRETEMIIICNGSERKKVL